MIKLPFRRKTLGQQAEYLAERWLSRQGLKPLFRNYHCRYGEIDLIMTLEDWLIFAEVRARKDYSFGGALESVTKKKQKKLGLAAQHFLLKHPYPNHFCRFDVLSITGPLTKPDYQWVQGAFDHPNL